MYARQHRPAHHVCINEESEADDMQDTEYSPVYANQVSAQIDAAVGNVSGLSLIHI